MTIEVFIQTVLEYYASHARDLPWRHAQANGVFDPYAVLVSEIMLQQTQASRVVPKYIEFLKQFPTSTQLAQAPLSDVLMCWSGLGYNRRAKFLWQAAQMVEQSYGGSLPKTCEQLTELPGVGKNTAGAILAYAHNISVPFIETNIRTVFIHHFFINQSDVSDVEILVLAGQALDSLKQRQISVRGWYWALMDYGVFLKSSHTNPARRSKHHVIQSKFEGSQRQLRGKVLKLLHSGPKNTDQLREDMGSDKRLESVLESLQIEGLISQKSNLYYLGDVILTG